MSKVAIVAVVVVVLWIVALWLDRRMKRANAKDYELLGVLIGGYTYLDPSLDQILNPTPAQQQKRAAVWWEEFSDWERNRLAVTLKWAFYDFGIVRFTNAGKDAARDYLRRNRPTPDHVNCRSTIIPDERGRQ
jgi:hypothetical protein